MASIAKNTKDDVVSRGENPEKKSGIVPGPVKKMLEGGNANATLCDLQVASTWSR